MKAAVFHGPDLPLTIEDVEIEKPAPREVLIRTSRPRPLQSSSIAVVCER